MSNVTTGEISGKSATSNIISITTGNKFYSRGYVVQTVFTRSDAQSTYSSNPSGNGTTVTDLNLTITPKFSNSLILLRWNINGEMHQDNVFLIHRDASLITTSGSEGYNNVSGNSRWSGIASAFYDQDENSTPSSWYIQYAIPASGISSRIYAPAVRSSSGGTYALYLNRTVNASASDNYEKTVSSGIAMEICQ